MEEKLGFVIIRYVNSEKTNEYWKENIRQIRKFYPTNIIMIVDDNSDLNFINNSNVDLNNCFFIKSEYEKRGELLGYYYFYKYHLFEKAVIIHDSIFIQKHIDFDRIEKVKFLWTFRHCFNNPVEERKTIDNLINTNELLNIHNNLSLWKGCFGGMSVIEYDFLKNIQEKYSFFNIINYINEREKRYNFERLIGLVSCAEYPELNNECSLFGDIHQYIRWGVTFDEYLNMKNNGQVNNFPIMKVWSGR